MATSSPPCSKKPQENFDDRRVFLLLSAKYEADSATVSIWCHIQQPIFSYLPPTFIILASLQAALIHSLLLFFLSPANSVSPTTASYPDFPVPTEPTSPFQPTTLE